MSIPIGRARKLEQKTEKELWIAVLFQAIRDAQSANKKIRKDARNWFMDDAAQPYSFCWLMDIIGRKDSYRLKLRKLIKQEQLRDFNFDLERGD